MILAFGTCGQCGKEYQKKTFKFPTEKARPLIRRQKYCNQKCREAAQRRLTRARKERIRKYRENEGWEIVYEERAPKGP